MKRTGAVTLALFTLLAFAGCGGPKTASKQESPSPIAASGAQEVHLTVTDAGFEPAQITLAKDRPTVLTVIRKTDKTCATEIVFKEIDVKQDLPLNQEVRIELPARPAGTLNYACGMDMIKGSLVVQ